MQSTRPVCSIDASHNLTPLTRFIQYTAPELLFKDVFNGLVPALVGGIPSGALFFGVKDSCKSYLKNINAEGSLLPFALSKDEITIFSVALANIPYWVSLR